MELISGDIFFKYKFIKQYPVFTELYVYPDIKNIRNFNVDFKKIVGKVIAKRHVIEDPFEFRSIREYYPFDSLKAVNWKASAKTGNLKVNQYHFTSSQEVVILLDLEGYNAYDRPEIKEDLIRIAAYLTRSLIKNGMEVGLVSNCRDPYTKEEIFASCKNGANQQNHIFRLFARISADSISRPFLQVIDNKVMNRRTPYYILVSCYAGEDLQLRVQELVAGGYSLQWLFVKDMSRKIAVRKQKNLIICEAEY
jgi:uncharacterized protein (DUF58 family)